MFRAVAKQWKKFEKNSKLWSEIIWNRVSCLKNM